MESEQSRPLPNRPEVKMPLLPKGSRIHKRPLPTAPFHLRQLRREQNYSQTRQNKYRRQATSASSTDPAYDPDGYRPPPRATHTIIIKVSPSAPFMSIVKRVRNALENNGPQKTKGLPLTARIAALEVEKDQKAKEANMVPIADALDDVVLIGTGRAIQKAVELGCFFTREKDLLVIPRTRTLTAIDDVEMGDDEEGDDGLGGDEVRVRNLSCIEVGIRWA